MNALSIGHMALHVLPGLSPWIIPVIAMAAKRTYDRPLHAERPVKRANDAPADEVERAASPRVTHERWGVRREARPWSD